MSKFQKVSLPASMAVGIAYADVFDYPLTSEEVVRWSVGTSSGRVLPKSSGYFVLGGQMGNILKRKHRAQQAVKKWSIAKDVCDWLRVIPTISLIGVTGGLAMNNTKKDDDIDLFFITTQGSLWVTRLLVTLMVESLRLRRRPSDGQVANKVCLNMFMTEDALGLPHKEQDLFAAHEILQMVPLMERRGAYSHFLQANSWVSAYLPNAWAEKRYHNRREKYKKRVIISLISSALSLFEPIARFLQLRYMANRQTHEVISDTVLRFHPRDARIWVKKEFAKRLRRLHIPLDNIFYGS